MQWTFKEIDKTIKTDSFDCGVPALNEYLQKYARQNHDKGLGKTHVAVKDGNRAVGYYTISSAQVNSPDLPEETRMRLPKYPVPAIRIGRLAIDKMMKGKGLGRELLMHSLTTILDISKKVGVFLVLVDAKDESAIAFYKKYGFVPFPETPNTLFLQVSSL